MKNLIVTLSLILCTSYGFAQNKNVQTEEKTTVRTVRDSDGEKKIVKKEEKQEKKRRNKKRQEETRQKQK